VECFGPEASEFTKHELTGRVVRLESDIERRDVELAARRHHHRGLWGEC
jgi:hypothetical protein